MAAKKGTRDEAGGRKRKIGVRRENQRAKRPKQGRQRKVDEKSIED